MVVQSAKSEVVLALHGWLAGPEVAEFERVVGTAPLPLRIDLANLVGADSCGISALCAQRERGAHLANASPYIAILLDSSAEQPQPRRGKRAGTTRG
jgi:hypothetical protein